MERDYDKIYFGYVSYVVEDLWFLCQNIYTIIQRSYSKGLVRSSFLCHTLPPSIQNYIYISVQKKQKKADIEFQIPDLKFLFNLNKSTCFIILCFLLNIPYIASGRMGFNFCVVVGRWPIEFSNTKHRIHPPSPVLLHFPFQETTN